MEHGRHYYYNTKEEADNALKNGFNVDDEVDRPEGNFYTTVETFETNGGEDLHSVWLDVWVSNF